MSVKNYGIYLAFPPTVDLRAEGLGRQLAMFLKGAQAIPDIQFTIVCPSWSVRGLNELFESERLTMTSTSLVAPYGEPYALRIFQWIRRMSAPRTFPKWLRIAFDYVNKPFRLTAGELVRRAVAVYDIPTLSHFIASAVLFAVLLLPIMLAVAPVVLIWYIYKICATVSTNIRTTLLKRSRKLRDAYSASSRIIRKPEKQGWVLQLFDSMQAQEIKRMHKIIDQLNNIRAWYCPTAFWPSFQGINAPRLMCVPDVVLTDFPTGFAGVGGDFFLNTFEKIGAAIRAGHHFVTYSDYVKWNTLVKRYAVSADRVLSVPHAPNTLNQFVDIGGFANSDEASLSYCRKLFRQAFDRSSNVLYTSTFSNGEVKYIFFASQFRPNKNIITLLRAYRNLLRVRYIGHKLILTGNPATMPEIQDFICKERLEFDVIFLHGLTVSELAACYKLADLVVNPTFSEGGCPFTFTEALSVRTPTVMSDIPVTREIIKDKRLADVTFFDPYSWEDCALRIEWALTNRSELLAIQLPFYEHLLSRTWEDVAKEHIAYLEKIARSATNG